MGFGVVMSCMRDHVDESACGRGMEKVGTRGFEFWVGREECDVLWWITRGRAISLDGGVVEKIYIK